MEEPYEKLKAFTRGQTTTQEGLQNFVDGLDSLPAEAKRKLAQLTPMLYVGNAAQQARELDAHLEKMLPG